MWSDDLTQLAESRGPQLRRFAYLLTHDWHDADDLLQDALLRPPLPASPTRSEQTVPTPQSFFTMPDPCGRAVEGLLPSIGLRITTHGSLSVPATTHWSPDKLFASLPITVTNETASEISGITSDHPYVVVTNKAGVVVGASSGFRAVANRLVVPAHGRVSMHAPVPLTRCNRAKGSPPGIPPGAYSLWVDIDVAPGGRSTT